LDAYSNCTKPRPAQDSRRNSFRAATAERTAALLRELVAGGYDGDDLLIEIAEREPRLTLHEFVGGLILLRAESGAPGYALVPGRVQ
jgi:hypothetical protein